MGLGLDDGQGRFEHPKAEQRLDPNPAHLLKRRVHGHRQKSADQRNRQRRQENDISQHVNRLAHISILMSCLLRSVRQQHSITEQCSNEAAGGGRMKELERLAHHASRHRRSFGNPMALGRHALYRIRAAGMTGLQGVGEIGMQGRGQLGRRAPQRAGIADTRLRECHKRACRHYDQACRHPTRRTNRSIAAERPMG